MSIGLTRLFSQLVEQDIVKPQKKSIAEVLIVPLTFLASTTIKKKFKYANKIGIHQVIVIGADEVSRGTFTLQNMISGEKRELTLDEFLQLTD